MFQLTEEEKALAVANCDYYKRLKFSLVRPNAFTEHSTLKGNYDKTPLAP